MPAKQSNALMRNPNQLNMVQVNQYERRIKASITRVWENVLDWEHLPWLHDTSFDYVSLDEGGEWGWRTWSNPEKTASVELAVNQDASEYVARSYTGNQQVSEIWTQLTPVDNHTDIKVTFDLPDIKPEQVDKLGTLFLSLYTKLWDEDEQMMQEREHQLNRKMSTQAPKTICLEKPLTLPTTVSLGSGEWTIRVIDGKTLVHSAICPHLLGPIDHDAKIVDAVVTCPWHGYSFDVSTGECVKPIDAKCKLKTPPTIIETDKDITLNLA